MLYIKLLKVVQVAFRATDRPKGRWLALLTRRCFTFNVLRSDTSSGTGRECAGGGEGGQKLSDPDPKVKLTLFHVSGLGEGRQDRKMFTQLYSFLWHSNSNYCKYN